MPVDRRTSPNRGTSDVGAARAATAAARSMEGMSVNPHEGVKVVASPLEAGIRREPPHLWSLRAERGILGVPGERPLYPDSKDSSSAHAVGTRLGMTNRSATGLQPRELGAHGIRR